MAEEKLDLLISRGKNLPHDHGLLDTEAQLEEDVDQEKLQRGISFFRQNFFSMFVSMLTGLLSLMYIETIASVLDATKKSNSTTLSFQRYLSTLNHTVQWYRDLPSLLKSSSRVRVLHRQAASLKSFSQYEMVVTQWAFVGPVLLWPEHLGVDLGSEEDIDGVLHVMMMVGRQLGISEEFNLCRGGREECTEYSRLILEKIIKPTFDSPESSVISKKLAHDLLGGVNILNPFISPRAFKLWAKNLINEDRRAPVPDDFSNAEKILYRTQKAFLSSLIHINVVGGVIRSLANNLMKLNIFLANEWKDFVLCQASENNKNKIDLGLGASQAFLIIPVLVTLSLAKILYLSMLKYRSEIAVIVMLTIAIVILTMK